VKVQRFDPAADSEAVRACYEIYRSGVPMDDPVGPPMPFRYFAGWLAFGWTADPIQAWLARDGADEACGWYSLTLPQRENRHLADVFPMVHAARRRNGLGTALIRNAAAHAHQLGRARLSAHAREGSPGSEFARALGATQGITEVRRVLKLGEIPAGRLGSLRTEAETSARGYSLLSWEGAVPANRLTGVMAIYETAIADMPREAGYETQHWDAERLRMDERRIEAQGLRYHTVAAVSRSTGELAGLTELAVDPAEPRWAHQGLTAVARPHRGHRLGLLVKIAMLELLAEREPRLTHIITGNADRNDHMIAINATLGFRVLDRWPSWEIDVASLISREPARSRGPG
jgi:GNAT superfamily N-acetyltransferase